MWKLKAKQGICIVFIILSLNIGYVANAIELFDLNKKGSLEIYHSYISKPLENVEFSIYKVASLKSTSDFEISNEFKDYSIDFGNLESESDWYLLVDTLASYIEVDNIKPEGKKKTNAYGKVIFDDLEMGLYLVVGQKITIDDKIYEVKPSLVILPTRDDITNGYNYNLSIKSKCGEIPVDKVNYKVEKKWTNDKEEARPSSIKVTLYNEGKIYGTVKLSKENNWKYEWTGLDNKLNWTVVEENIPNNYTVTYEKYDNNTIITNTFDENPKTGDNDSSSMQNSAFQFKFIGLVLIIMMIFGYSIIESKVK